MQNGNYGLQFGGRAVGLKAKTNLYNRYITSVEIRIRPYKINYLFPVGARITSTHFTTFSFSLFSEKPQNLVFKIGKNDSFWKSHIQSYFLYQGAATIVRFSDFFHTLVFVYTINLDRCPKYFFDLSNTRADACRPSLSINKGGNVQHIT